MAYTFALINPVYKFSRKSNNKPYYLFHLVWVFLWFFTFSIPSMVLAVPASQAVPGSNPTIQKMLVSHNANHRNKCISLQSVGQKKEETTINLGMRI